MEPIASFIHQSNVVVDLATEYGPEVAEAIRQTVQQSVRSQANFAKAVEYAAEEVRRDQQDAPQESVDDDWFNAWRASASTVSAEAMQRLWGRLLAGEIKAPGTFSLRCLEFIKLLSPAEALQINEVAPYVIENFIWRDESSGIPFPVLLAVQDLGLIVGVDGIGGLTLTYCSSASERFVKALRSNGKVVIVTNDDGAKKLEVSAIMLTALGRQVFRFASMRANVQYLTDFGKHLKKGGFDVSLADFEQVDANTAKTFNAVVL